MGLIAPSLHFSKRQIAKILSTKQVGMIKLGVNICHFDCVSYMPWCRVYLALSLYVYKERQMKKQEEMNNFPGTLGALVQSILLAATLKQNYLENPSAKATYDFGVTYHLLSDATPWNIIHTIKITNVCSKFMIRMISLHNALSP